MTCEVMTAQEIPAMSYMQPATFTHQDMATAVQPLLVPLQQAVAMQAGMMLVPMQAAVAMQAGMMAMTHPQMGNQIPQEQQCAPQATAVTGYELAQTMVQPYMESQVYSEGHYVEDAATRRRRRPKVAPQPKAPGMVLPQPAKGQVEKQMCSERISELQDDWEKGAAQVALDAINGKIFSLSKDELGCRLVQSALEKAEPRVAKALSSELHGHVRELATSPHGNFVLQKIVTQLAPSVSNFIAEELLGNGARFARHRFGCRILCRLLEHGSTEEAKQLIDEILEDQPLELCRHSFGHHVVQSILEHGCDQHKEHIAEVLLSDLLANARHRSASYVVEAALGHCSPVHQTALLEKLSIPAIVADLAQSNYGCFVARTLLQRAEVDAEAMAKALPSVAALLANPN